MQIPFNSYRERSLTHLVSKVIMLIQITSFLILNTVLVFGINVPDDTHNDSVICMDKTLLNSCTKTCGESQCDMDSFCGEDRRCLYCYDEICKSTPIKYGCEISCAKRFPGMFEVSLESFPCSLSFVEFVNYLSGTIVKHTVTITKLCIHLKKNLFLTIKLVMYTSTQ